MLNVVPYAAFPVAAVLFGIADGSPSWESLGIGGVLAGVMFYFYRADRQVSEKRIADIQQSYREVITENTAALTALKTVIEHEAER